VQVIEQHQLVECVPHHYREVYVRRTLCGTLVLMAMTVAVGTTIASADPVRSPNKSFGTLVCGSVTYTVVSPSNAPVGQVLTANGSDSSQVLIMVVDKAGSAFPANLLTTCTAYPPDEAPFTTQFLITPV
jgi:hypothetical protein